MLGSSQKIELFECGQLGGVLVTGTGMYSGNFGAVKFLQNTTAVFSGTNIANMDGYTGSYIQGDIVMMAFHYGNLISGSAIFYTT